MNDDRDDVAFLTGSGSSDSRVYSKRDLYEKGHVAVCSHRQAMCITVFVFTAIFCTALVAAFARPFSDCLASTDITDHSQSGPKIPIATNGETFPWNNVRLPMFIRPLSYDIELTPNLTTLAVKGIIKLIFQVTEETDFIIFHAKNLTITSKTINEKLKVNRLLEYPEREQVYFETNKAMKPGKTFSIRLKFQYNISRSLEGFYLSTYTDKNGQTKRLATTHFEPTYARKAFPCFDEPQLKATFLVTITHDKNLKAFFNTPRKEQEMVRGKADQVRDEFEETVKMSTYLLAFVVCDFSVKSSQTVTNNITVSVIAAEGKIEQAQFALEMATKITDYYEVFFGVKYPLPKQDLIAIPDFGAGAMENWGLITYRETSLLYKEGETGAPAQQWVAVVVAHELAHQWFGNLVTMKWWNDLWLNEGFASWMEYQGVNYVQPDWRMLDQFYLHMIQPALSLDSMASSHPVSVTVNDPSEIEGIFDSISYKKGSSIIHMLESHIGEASLKKGLQKYLNDHKFGNAVTKDLWTALTEVAKANNNDINVEELMDTWTLQMGYPLITFEQLNGSSTYSISQSHFLTSSQLNGTKKSIPESQFNYSWVVPISFITDKSQVVEKVLLNCTNGSRNAMVDLDEDLLWIKANLNGSGYYRVNYPDEMWSQLILVLRENMETFSPTDRAQLLFDAFSLCRAGLLEPSIPLEMSLYLLKEKELVPWLTALSQLELWTDLMRESPGVEKLRGFILHLIGPMYNQLGWDTSGDHVQQLLRQRILEVAIAARDPSAIKEAVKRFRGLVDNKEHVPADLQDVVYNAGVRYGKEADWEYCFSKYNTTNVPSERSILLGAMAHTTDTYTLQRYLDLVLDKSVIRPQDVRTVISAVAKNQAGSLLAWRHIQRRWSKLFEMFGRGSFTMGAIIKGVTGHFSTQFDYDQVKSFFGNRNVGAGKRSLEQSLETIEINVLFRQKFEAKIFGWLGEKFPTR